MFIFRCNRRYDNKVYKAMKNEKSDLTIVLEIRRIFRRTPSPTNFCGFSCILFLHTTSHHTLNPGYITTIWWSRYQSSSASLRAGWMGLRSGIIGGITSIPNQVSRGITEDGLTGGMTGLIKGVIGTVTKPAAGLLDFASGTTLAITQSTRSSQSIG